MRGVTSGFVLTLCLISGLAPPADTSGTSKQEAPEEIFVTGTRSTFQLRVQLMEAEKAAYDIFNQFNDDMRFHISCSTNARTGSRFTRQVCQAEFEIQAMRGHAQDYLNSMPGVPGDGRIASQAIQQYLPVEVELQRHRKAYKEAMRKVAEEHPEFLDALSRYAALRQEYEARTGLSK